MPSEIHRNSQRGHVQHSWLQTAHSFSFARYVNPDRMNFGGLLVLNEDIIAPGMGFGEHFHDNMEIITIPLEGALQHGDSMGNKAVIRTGDVQIMSAGTGIMHSERNASDTAPVHLLQIWILPNQQGLPTRYEQRDVRGMLAPNVFTTVAAPHVTARALVIHQDAWLQMGQFETEQSFTLAQHDRTHGTFLLVVKGSVQIGNETLAAGDAYAMQDEPGLEGKTLAPSLLVAIEVPMLL